MIGETGRTKIGLAMAILVASSIAPHPHTQTTPHLLMVGTVVVVIAGVGPGHGNTDQTRAGTIDMVDTVVVITEVTEEDIKYKVKFY